MKTIWLINQYASTPQTGMGGRQYYLAKELAKLGYNVYLIAAAYTHLLRKPIELEGKKYILQEIDGFHMIWLSMPHYSSAHGKKRVLNWFLFAHNLGQLKSIIPDCPDVILYSSPSLVGYLGAERLARQFNCKLIFEVRDIWPLTLQEIGNYSRYHPFIRFLQYIEDRAYRCSDIILSNLKYAVDHMQMRGMDAEKFHWIPNGVDLAECSNAIALPTDIEVMFPRDKFIVGYAGTLGVANALNSLIDVAKQLKEEREIAFVLVGNGKEKAILQDKVDSAGLTNVTFIPAVPKNQVQTALAKCDALWIGAKESSLYQYGVAMNKLFDYLYSAKPIIYAINSGRYRPIDEAQAGIQIQPENVEILKNAILKLFHMSRVERQLIGQNARQLVLKEYNYANLARDLANLL